MADRIIIKKKSGHGGHHGGAWKVAYADFVTAMMALFIVLWLMNSSKQVQDAVGGYFKDPMGTSKMIGTNMKGAGENLLITKDDMPKLKEQLQMAISRVANFDKLSKQIEMTVTAEGLRIELLETETGTFFEIGSAAANQSGKDLLTALAREIGKLPNHVSIEGHTDSRPYGSDPYSNWELSVDRANVTRRLMSENGLTAGQVSQVRGYADRQLRYKDKPQDPGNRRISLIVEYLKP
ncbi:MAG TPA: flagellar motor protein MotB [Terriglobales bacterium]|nr:flagellar motor protein MotB [Terriglobales bacterium]